MDKCISQAEARGRYLKAAQSGDVKEIEWLLQNSKEFGLDINHTYASGLSALNIAIQNGHLVVLYPLLEHGVNINDDLLRAVEHNFPEAVRLLCNSALKSKDNAERRRIIDCRCTNDDFNHEITPIILAAQKNNFNIIKLLLDAGARIPTSRNADTKTASSDSFQRSVGTLALYRGLASNAYVALESNDPVDRAFKLCGAIRRLGETEIEYRLSYKEIELNLARFATEFISHARSSEEIITVLSHHDEDDESNGGEDVSHSPLPKISRAVKLKLLEFVAHPNCQQVIIAKFYKRLLYLRDRGAIYRTMFLSLIFLLYPLLAILHVYSARVKIKTFVRIPLVVFVMYLASDLTFVCLLTWEAMSDSGSAHAISLTRHQNFAVLLWIIGMVWQEIECIAAQGVRRVMTQWGHFRDIFIIVLFVIGISFEIASYYTATPPSTTTATVNHNLAKRSTDTNRTRMLLTTNFTDGKFSEIGDYVLDELASSNHTMNQTTKLQIKEVVGRVMNYSAKRLVKTRRKPTIPRVIDTLPIEYESDDFLQLMWYHPQIMGRAFLSLATALSVLRMLSYVVISNVLGPLQISFVRMIKGTSHFFVVLGMVVCSFAFGLTLTYSHQGNTEEKAREHRVGTFTGIFQSLLSLYWSLFGFMPIEDLHLPGRHIVKETAGYVLFATFYVFIVVVLLNALIAVWSKLYIEIEENSDVQWKFSRTAMWMRFIDNNVRVPPPFNLLPTTSLLRRMFGMFSRHSKWATIAVEDLKPTFDEKWLRTRGMPLLIEGRNQVYRQLEEQKRYNRVIGHLRDRYISEKTGDESSSTTEVTKEDIRNLRNDLISLRYDTFQKFCHVHEQFGTTKTNCIHLAKQSLPITAIVDRTGDIKSGLDQNLGSADVLQSSLRGIESEASETIQTLTEKVGTLSEKVGQLSREVQAASAKRSSSVPAPRPTPPPVKSLKSRLPSTESLCPKEPTIVESTPAKSYLQIIPPPAIYSSSSESLAVPCHLLPPPIICTSSSSESIETPQTPSLKLNPVRSTSMEDVLAPPPDPSISLPPSRRSSGQSDGGVHNIVVKLVKFDKGEIKFDKGEIKLDVKRPVGNRRGSVPDFPFRKKPWQI